MPSKSISAKGYIYSVAAIGLAFFFISANADAVVFTRVCTTWRAQYMDSSNQGGSVEDYDWSTSEMNVGADYSEYQLYEKNGSVWDPVENGYLSFYDGSIQKWCTPNLIAVDQGARYKFRQYTRVKRDNRLIMIMKDGATWASPNRTYIDTIYTMGTGYAEGSTVPPVSLSPTAINEFTSTVGIASQVMSRVNEVGWSSSPTDSIFISLDSRICGDMARYEGTMTWGGVTVHKLCVPTSAVNPSKFQAAHEIGHAIATIFEGPVPSDPSADASGVFEHYDPWWYTLPETCRCVVGSSGVRHAHCIQSREYVGTASGEAFANFIATVVYNNRDPVGYLNYLKEIYYSSTNIDIPPNWLRWDYQTRWIDTHCDPWNNWVRGLSAEWDWNHFFWQI